MRPDFSVNYLGLRLRSPLVASSSPATHDLKAIQALEQAGIGAVVLPSLFEEQIRHDELQIQHLHEFATESFAEALDYLPEIQDYNTGPSGYLYAIEQAKESLSIPVIGSLNGVTSGGWISHAHRMQEAGADAVELNMYILSTDGNVSASDIEQRYVDLVAEIRSQLTIPLAIKLAPHFTAPANMAKKLIAAGADGLVIFHRLVHPTIDLDHLRPSLDLVLSESWESRMGVRWIAILRDQIQASIAATTGAHNHEDVLRLLLAGADCVMLASALLQEGPSLVTKIHEQMETWLQEREYKSIQQLQGSLSLGNCENPETYERANYMRSLTSYRSPHE